MKHYIAPQFTIEYAEIKNDIMEISSLQIFHNNTNDGNEVTIEETIRKIDGLSDESVTDIHGTMDIGGIF